MEKDALFSRNTIIIYYYQKGISSLALIIHRNETKHQFSLDCFTNIARRKIEALSVSSLYVCLFSIYCVEVEIVARVYRAIFDLFLHSSSHHPAASRWRPIPPLFSTPVVTACSNTSVRHPPLFTTSKRRRCFFPLWCAKNFIRSLSNPSRRLVYEIR